ncbi:MAG: ParB/RepB/Spo0J family partition protein [Deltaproteobacteria bacterium]|nr:ParB/RepB/Spo0J family partition protein [Deltaproteobacteria bacterium]
MADKKKVLGRGISALLGDSYPMPERAGGSSHEKEGFRLCPIGDISPSSVQPRKRFEDAALRDLASSIKEQGIIEPLVARKTPNGIELIAGERRLRAAKLAGLKEVPIIIREASDEECLLLAIIENIQREELNPVEEAEGYKNLIGLGLSQDEVAKKVGKDRATVANHLRLLKLPPEVKDELVNGAITMGHARAILSLAGHSAQTELCRRIISKGLSVREAEAICSPSAGKKGKTVAKTSATPLEDELRLLFGTKVAVNDKRGKGKIEVFYFSADERERIIEMLRAAKG